MPFHGALKLVCATTLALLVLCVGAATAPARTLTATASSESAGSLVFRVANVAPAEVRAARLKLGRSARRLSLRRVRAGLRRGVVRVRRPRKRAARRVQLQLVVERPEPKPAPKPEPKPAPKPEPKPEPAPAPAPTDTPPAPTDTPPAPSEPPAETPAAPLPAPTPEPPAPPAGALYVSPAGSDAASGTQSAPWRTLDKALGSAHAGDTIVLKAGEYGRLGSVNQVSASGTDGAPITIMGEPGAGKPAILGYTRITGSHLRLSGLLFDGPTGAVVDKTASNPKGEEVLVSVMYGSDVEISGSEVRDSAWHAGVYVWNATGVRIVGNRIHDNGDRTDPSQANLDHGIYWAGGSGLVANNVIDHNVAYGVHVYPEANGVTVTQNTIVHSGRGGVIVADRAANTLVTNNVIADNDLYGIRGYDLTGTGNVARRNLVWHNGTENFSGAGISLSDNIVADPRLGTDLRPLSSSPAIDAASPGAVMPVDLDGVARPRGAGPDIGAYEAG